MKKLVVILLLFTYASMNAGIRLYGHYCAGTLTSISFSGEDNSCNRCGIKHKGCCEETSYYLSLNQDQFAKTNSPAFKAPVAEVSDVSTPFIKLTIQYSSALVSSDFYAHETGPPKTPMYIQIRSLLI